MTDSSRASLRIGPRLSPFLWGAALPALVIYFFLKTQAGAVSHPFAVAAATGLAFSLGRFALIAWRLGLRIDADGVTDIRGPTRIAFSEIEAVRLEVLDGSKSLSPNVAGTFRAVTLLGRDGRAIRFGDFYPNGEFRLGRYYNIRESAAILAVVADRTACEEIYPEGWKAAAAASPDAAELKEAASPAESRGAALARRAREAWAMIPLLFKVGPKLGAIALKLLKTVKPAAVLVTLGAYGMIFSWKFAFALIAMILFHECGHVFAMRRSGLRVKGIYFIPFVGGMAVSEGHSERRSENAFIALNGPIWGTALVLACWALFRVSGGAWPVFAALAAWGALLNLFNLLPILPLDGGRILNNISHSWGSRLGAAAVLASLMLGGALAYWMELELLFLMVLIGGIEFGGQLEASRFAAVAAELGPGRPLRHAEFEHFNRWVAPVEAGRTTAKSVAERRQGFESREAEAKQRPMTGREALRIIAGYLALLAVLFGVMLAARAVPGAGDPMQFLK